MDVFIEIPNAIIKRITLTKTWNLNMLPKDTKRSEKHFHKKCTCFTSKQTKAAVFKGYIISVDLHSVQV